MVKQCHACYGERASEAKSLAGMDIPVLKVALPSVAELTPYLQRIDQSRIYSNFGPLLLEFEARLAGRLGLEPAGLVGVANATLGLTAALQAQQPEPGSLCLMPAWTFIASPLAALGAGLRPCFLDVDPEDWALHPAAVLAALPDLPGRAGAVMPVAPFGLPLDGAAWDDFRDRTGLAVAIDSAAAFDTMQPVRVPSVVSLHATKALGVGEGGFVASTDTALIKRIRALTSFGFSGSREAILPGTNAKLNEYQAALGLAGLDGWAGRRAAIAGRIAAYRAAFGDSNRIAFQRGFGADWIANTLVVRLPDGTAPRVLERLEKAGIQARHWWGAGAHAHPATHDMPHLPLPATELLARSTIGLPFHAELLDAEILRIAAEVKQALEAVGTQGCAPGANP